MILRRFYDESLAHASYLIGCEKSREAIVVDPGLDVDQYDRAATSERLRISRVTETHIHADFVSGARALARAANATLHLSAEGANEWSYAPVALEDAETLASGSTITLGNLTVEALHTPGHTPEHITLLITDRARGREPVGAVTGDFIFVGDVGRPDLLEVAGAAAGSAERLAAELFGSIQKFQRRPDHLQLWPGHGAGSACGKSLGSMRQTTLGYERLYNWAFGVRDEREFVSRVLERQPVAPRYFAEMKRINREAGVPEAPARPEIMNADDVDTARAAGATVVDTRSADHFAERHVPGSLNIPLGKSFLNWMGSLVPYDRDLYLIVETDDLTRIDSVVADLRKIGLTRVEGYADTEIVETWMRSHGKAELRQVDVRSLKATRENQAVQVIDVRSPDEWHNGHIPGAVHIPLAALPDRISLIDPDVTVVLQCQGGSRSAIAASFLQSHGIANVADLKGGFDAWRASGLPVERPG